MSDLPTGTVTFLFTDIEGSTRLWEDAEEPMRAAMVRHDEIVDRIVADCHGVNVSPRGEGDSRFIVFPDATEAVTAAIALQRTLQAEIWDLPRPIKVRIALHTGIADMRGGDYYGSAVNRSARLRSLAHGGQTVISGSTHELVQDSLPPGISLRDMGLHGLKDLTRPEHVFQVNEEGLPADFPPLKSLDVLRHNLPTQLNELIGREREGAELAELLHRERFVTILAPGGTGKTRLAVDVAAEVADAFPDGVFMVPLAPITNSDSVPQAVAEAIDISLSSDADMQEQLLDYLRAKQQLLVLDNFEHLTAAATLVPAILAAAPGVRVLATSRTRLNVSSEVVYPLGGLGTDGATDLLDTDAARLFVTEATRANPAFRLEPDDEAPLRQILQLTQGTPLAILLAAAWVDTLPVREIAEEIARSVDFLESEQADMPDRHRSMRAVFDYSWVMLSDDERRLFSQLSLFRGGFTRAAARATADASPRDLARLANKSFIVADPSSGRFAVHELLRQYGEESLEDEPALRAETVEKHVAFYVERLEEADRLIIGGEQPDAVDLVEADLDNIRAAWSVAVEAGGADFSTRAAFALWFIYEVHGWHLPGSQLFGAAAAALANSADAPLPLRAFCLAGQSWFVGLTGDPARGREYGDQSLAILESLAPSHVNFFAISCRNINLLYAGAMEEMFATNAAAIETAHGIGDDWWSNLMRDWTSHALLGLGRFAEAQTVAAQAQAFWEQTGDHWGMIWSLEALAGSARAEGRLGEAGELYRRLLQVNQELGFRRGMLHTVNNLGITSLAAGDPAAAEGYLIDGLRISTEVGQIQESLAALCDIADARTKQGDPQRALELLAAVIAHPASEQHQRYNPRSIREIAEDERARLIEAGAVVDPATPARPFEAVVASLLEGSKAIATA
ncbi:MAG: NB-ARC domain-containing protein [Chloroflexi bacterium]|nr:NB-ARC domain-containing protein [Chloroflexota bacterium]MDA1145357.1 NB-ARC domain-containing protein [Chloroflexota bacterium]